MKVAERPTHARRVRTGLGVLALLGVWQAVPGATGAARQRHPAPRREVSISERRDTTHARLDLRRVAFAVAPDRRLRATISTFSAWANTDLFAGSGPPGSVCLRLWATSRPARLSPADYLVCATVAPDGHTLRGAVLANRAHGLPRRVGTAAVVRATPRSIILRFGQSAVGRPQRLSFAAESTRGGCSTVGCVDVLPEGGGAGLLVLRSAPTAHAGAWLRAG